MKDAIKPQLEKALLQWQQLSIKDQRALSIAAIAISLFLIVILIIQPVYDYRDNAQLRLSGSRAALQTLQKKASEIKQSGGATTNKGGSNKSLLSSAERSAQKHQLSSAIKRMQPSGKDQLQIWLEKASYPHLISWLLALEKQGINTQRASIQAQDSSAELTIQLTLSR